jgi:hypothetical protein
MTEDRALFRDFTYTQFRDDSDFRDMNGLIAIHNPPKNLVHSWRYRVRTEDKPDEIAYDIWIYVYDMSVYPTFIADSGVPRFIYEAEVHIQRDSDEGPSVNLKYAVKSPMEARETAFAVWQALDCPTHT